MSGIVIMDIILGALALTVVPICAKQLFTTRLCQVKDCPRTGHTLWASMNGADPVLLCRQHAPARLPRHRRVSK